jgi:hypothetical protein
MSIIIKIPNTKYFDLETWIANVRSFESIHERNKLDILYYVFSDDNFSKQERPIILCRIITEEYADHCFFLQTYYCKGEYSTIDCVCLQEKSYQMAISNYFKYILTSELSQIEFELANQQNRFIEISNKINSINKNIFTINMPIKEFLNFNFSDLVNFIFFPEFYPYSPAKIYIQDCLLAMVNNLEEKEFYQKIYNIYQDKNFVKNLFRQDNVLPKRQDDFENILGLLDIKFNRENIFNDTNNNIVLT